jgi:WD40 repeat protein
MRGVLKKFTSNLNHLHALARVALIALFVACGQVATQKPISNGESGTLNTSQIWSTSETQSSHLDFERATWVSNDEIYLSGRATYLWKLSDQPEELPIKKEYGSPYTHANWNENHPKKLLTPSYLIDISEFESAKRLTLTRLGYIKDPLLVTLENPFSMSGYGTSAWSPSGAQIAVTGCGDGGPYIYDVEGEFIKELNLPFPSQGWCDLRDRQYLPITWASENKLLVYYDYPLAVNTDTKKIEKEFPYTPLIETDPQRNRIILYSYEDGFLRWLNADDYSNIKAYDLGKSGLYSSIAVSKVTGETAVGDSFGYVRVFDSAGQQIKKLQVGISPFEQITYSPDGTKAITIANQLLQIWDTATWKLVARVGNIYYKPESHQANVYQLVLSKDQKTLHTIGRDTTTMTFNSSYGDNLEQWATGSRAGYAIGFSSDGSKLATAGEDGVIRIWNSSDRALIGTLEGHTYIIRSLAWTPDNSRIISAGWDDTVRIWNAETQNLETTLNDHTNYVNTVQIHPDGLSFASASSDGTIKLRSTTTGQAILTLQAEEPSEVYTVAYNKTGSIIASGSTDHRVRLWNTSTGVLEATLSGLVGAVRSMVWLKDDVLVAGGADGRILAWNTTTQNKVLELEPNHGMVFALTARLDGTQLFAGFADGNVQAWTVN